MNTVLQERITGGAANLVGDECESRVVQVEPGRDLAVGDEKNLANPRSVLLEGADRITQLLQANKIISP